MLVRKIAVTLCRNLCCKKNNEWMNEWMNSMNVLFPDRLRYRECHWTSWLPAPLQGADFFACEWGNPDVSERVNRTTRIAQVFRYLLLSSIIMTAGASLHTSVNQHAQRHWCITPVVWRRHQKLHKYSDTYYLLLSSIIMTAGASLHTSVNQHAQRHWCITPVVWQRHPTQVCHQTTQGSLHQKAQTLKRNDTDTWEIGQKDTKQTELSMW